MTGTKTIVVIKHVARDGWDILSSENGYQFFGLGLVFPDEASAMRVATAIQREFPDAKIESKS